MFEIGKEYKRKEEIHGVYGGQAQGGISTPKNHPVVFIFTSDSGEQHGYRDEYHDDGLFWYTGEGQIGDMKMVSGNKAIFEHAISGKAIHVFEYIRKAYVRYIGSAECLGYHEEDRPDREGNNRTAFVFHLDIDSSGNENTAAEPKAIFSPESPKQLKNKSIKDLRKAALSQSYRTSTPKEKQESAPFQTKSGPYLECHHVHRLADGGPDHPENVVALCPNCHRRAHFSNDAQAYNETLKKVAHEAEQNSL